MKQYSIATRHQRSTRIDTDLSQEFFQGLVYHGTAQSTLETLLRQFSQANQSAYTITGPYGSGKSTIALLLTGLLNQDSKLRKAALDVINPESTSLLNESISYSEGWLQIRSVSGVSNPISTFWSSTISALKEHSKTDTLYKKYKNTKITDESHLVQVWEKLFTEANELVDGVLIIADEMGKSLEFFNKNKGDLHLFQDLAEVLGRIKTPVIFVGLLHQSFSEYAKDRGTKLQEDWGKIQGRYNDILYNVSTDETVALIANSITRTSPHPIYEDSEVNRVLSALNDTPERKYQLKNRLEKCIPLHPLTALLLGPISKRRFSQNERSTFSFLNSHEYGSFQLFLQNNTESNARYTLENLWSYLEINLEHAILSSPDGHAWAAAAESIRQANRKLLPPKSIEILKSIALITLFGKAANLYATEEILLACTDLKVKKELEQCIQKLKSASCIIYRKHLSSWVVFEGSDLDIPSLIEEKIEQQGSSTEAIRKISFSKQTIAKGYYHKTGTLRWAEQSITPSIDADYINNLISNRKGEFADLVLILQGDKASVKELTKNEPTLILALAESSEEIISLAREVYALSLIKADKEIGRILQHDNVALKEYSGRLSAVESSLNKSINYAFDNAMWFHNGKQQETSSLSKITSEAAHQIFNKTPVIINELVNRNKLSGAAASGLKKLLEAMLTHEREKNLAILGSPPELSMYISCLKKTGIHNESAKNNNHWNIDSISDEKTAALFNAAHELIKDNAERKVKLSEITKTWFSKPYGITQGLAPIYLFSLIKSLNNEIALYERNISEEYAFIAKPDIDYVHRLIKSPQDLAIKYIKLRKKDEVWLQHLAVFASTERNKDVPNNLLSIATSLVTTIYNLPHWVKNAQIIVDGSPEGNDKITAVRDLFLHVNDPHSLLIVDIPDLLDSYNDIDFSQKIDALEFVFRALRSKHEKMLLNIKNQIHTIFPEKGQQLVETCQFVEKNSGDIRLKAFARELAKSEDSLLLWLENIIQIVTSRGKKNWNENTLLNASIKISEFSQSFLSIAKSQNIKNHSNQKAINTKLISLVLEDNNGKLHSYKKEITHIEEERVNKELTMIKNSLINLKLSDFEKIHILQSLLKDSLKPTD